MSRVFSSRLSATHYHDVAESFLQQSVTQPASDGDIGPWRRGRKRYWCWCIELKDSVLLARYRDYQKRLAPYLLTPYLRAPHITVAVCGFWLPERERPRFNDDFSESQLAIQRRNLAGYRSETFELQVLGANSFPSAPFLEVVDNSPDGHLRQLRRCLMGDEDDFRSSVYLPHITLGLYNGEYAASELLRLLTQGHSPEPLRLEVSALSLMSYDSADLTGALTLEQQVLLSS